MTVAPDRPPAPDMPVAPHMPLAPPMAPVVQRLPNLRIPAISLPDPPAARRNDPPARAPSSRLGCALWLARVCFLAGSGVQGSVESEGFAGAPERFHLSGGGVAAEQQPVLAG